MLTVDEALRLVLGATVPLSVERRLAVDAVGCRLQEDVRSDIDAPPHDKSLVDGYAVRAVDVAQGSTTLMVLEEVPAGAWPQREVSGGQATRIMTGAPIPPGADAVVMLERTDLLEDNHVRVDAPDTVPGDHLLAQGSLFRSDDVVVSQGTRLRPIEVGLLAEAGHAEVTVVATPKVAVLVTGNELVPSHQIPGPGQIRNSNGPLLQALIATAASESIDLGIAGDTRAALSDAVRRGLDAVDADILLLSGGVSAGDFDFVPEVLQALQVDQVFHGVRLKPGKPLWFGVRRRDPAPQLVFGLPGNPLSAAVCFELFVRLAIRKLAGDPKPRSRVITARLATSHRHRGNRPMYHPARLTTTPAGLMVEPVSWRGSADQRGFAQGNALVHFPAGDHDFDPGDTVDVTPLD